MTTLATPPARSDLRGVARNGALGLVGAAVAALGGFILTTVVARGLGATGAGRFFQAVALFSMVSSVAACGADTGLVRALSQARARRRRRELGRTVLVALLPVLCCGVAAAAVMALLAGPLARSVLHVPGSVNLVRALAAFVALGSVGTVLLQGTRGLGSVAPYVAVQNVAIPALRPLLIGALLAFGVGATGVTVAWGGLLVPATLAGGALLIRALRRVRPADDPLPRPWSAIASEFWRFAGLRGLAAIVDVTLLWFDVLLVGALRTPREAGIYAAASRFITTGTLVMQAMRLGTAPQISDLVTRREYDRTETIYKTSTQWIVASSWPLYLALAAGGPFVLQLFGPSFTAGADALAILALAMLVNLATGNVETVLLMSGCSRYILTNKLVAIALNITLNLLLVPHHGIVGAALAWAASIVLDNVAAALEVRWLLCFRGYGRGTVAAAVSAAVCFGGLGLVFRTFVGAGAGPVFGYLALAVPIYAGLLWHFRAELNLDELRHLLPTRSRGRHRR